MWTDETPGNNADSRYNHCSCETPIGLAVIEWKSWKSYPGYTLEIGGDFVGCFDSLDEAKQEAVERVKVVGSKCIAWIVALDAACPEA